MANNDDPERFAIAADELRRELTELRALDERRHAHPPGSEAHAEATAEIEARNRSLMDRLRDGAWPAAAPAAAPEPPEPREPQDSREEPPGP